MNESTLYLSHSLTITHSVTFYLVLPVCVGMTKAKEVETHVKRMQVIKAAMLRSVICTGQNNSHGESYLFTSTSLFFCIDTDKNVYMVVC